MVPQPPVQVTESYPAAFDALGKIVEDMCVAVAKIKATPGASVAQEIEAAVVASVPDLVQTLGQITDLSGDFSASPISCIQALVNRSINAVKALTGKQ